MLRFFQSSNSSLRWSLIGRFFDLFFNHLEKFTEAKEHCDAKIWQITIERNSFLQRLLLEILYVGNQCEVWHFILNTIKLDEMEYVPIGIDFKKRLVLHTIVKTINTHSEMLKIIAVGPTKCHHWKFHSPRRSRGGGGGWALCFTPGVSVWTWLKCLVQAL